MYLSVCVVFILIGTTLGKKNDLNPGIQTKITQKGLEYGKQVALSFAEQKIQEFPLPEISGTISTFGLKYHITGMRVRRFGLPVSDVGLIPNTGFKSSVEKAYIGISGNWHTIFGLIHDGGTFDLNINDLSAAFIVGVSLDSSRPMITYNNCVATLGDLDLKMYGGGSWFYKMFLGKVKDLIRQIIPKQLCSEFRNRVGKLEDVIQTLRVSWQLDKYVEFDYSLVGEPEITTDFIDFPIKGELYDVQHHTEAPFTAQLFNLSNITNQMLVVGLSEYSVNTGGFAYFVAGALQFNITNDMIPKDIPFQLNTSSLNFLLPEVAKEYPNLLMKVVMSATKQPIVKLVPGKFSSDVFTAAEVFVILPNNSLAELFLLGITASVSGQVYTSYGKLHGSVSLSSVDLVLEESKVGTIPVNQMETVLKLGLQKIVIPKINAKLKKGLPIPKIDKIALINPIIEIDQGSILFATDIQYGN
ncbi:bactericidal permeability-increasing protein-like [Leucoraja erinacea]|uniref:bactericidal permeability-increasing protein-like n=1 Tax=Leucoraja erinaceus TaxID=7782 RepID=UPI00245526FF|nr:bactericidal permeability-increasing protein-like [Leucoraja erinacea]